VPYTPELTKASIYEAAVAEFVAYGFAGARVDRIAKAAGADKKAIYLYFGDKRSLFETVLATELGSVAAPDPIDPHDIAGYVGRLFDHQRAHPEHLRLMMWEALELGDSDIPGVGGRTADYRARPQPIAEAQQNGELDPSLDPGGLWLALAGMVNWALGVSPMTRMTLGDGPEALDGQRALVVELARRVLGQPAAGDDPAMPEDDAAFGELDLAGARGIETDGRSDSAVNAPRLDGPFPVAMRQI
jgi:AcrR family transcriptional regulator